MTAAIEGNEYECWLASAIANAASSIYVAMVCAIDVRVFMYTFVYECMRKFICIHKNCENFVWQWQWCAILYEQVGAKFSQVCSVPFQINWLSIKKCLSDTNWHILVQKCKYHPKKLLKGLSDAQFVSPQDAVNYVEQNNECSSHQKLQ